ncbi:MAG: NAD(P)-dependent oxidoreductase [Bacteroidetes bacterium]|nr:NAD(P)-dependent oxidoreductase [Bacteroidota bacterium]
MKSTILITGITGFLGSSIGEILCKNEYRVIATKRKTSNLKNCIEYSGNVIWIDLDMYSWKENIVAFEPEIIIHAAWKGVELDERNNWEAQINNILFFQDLLEIAKKSKTKKIIALGSQAEYGHFDKVVSENQPLKSTTAYGVTKIIISQLLEGFSKENKIEWYWLRIFSIYGEKQSTIWLLPSVIVNIGKTDLTSMDFSKGEQKYSYLYIQDFSMAILKIVQHTQKSSGFYNISASKLISIKDIVTYIRDYINPLFILNFGVFPYRNNQLMHIVGDTKKFRKVFGEIESTTFEIAITNIIKFHMSQK